MGVTGHLSLTQFTVESEHPPLLPNQRMATSLPQCHHSPATMSGLGGSCVYPALFCRDSPTWPPGSPRGFGPHMLKPGVAPPRRTSVQSRGSWVSSPTTGSPPLRG